MLFLGLVLVVIKLPENLMPFKPNLVVLTLFYVCLYMPERINILSAWIIGLLLDSLDGFILGNNAVQFAVFATVLTIFQRRIRMYTIVQQSLILLLLSLLIMSVEFGLMYITQNSGFEWLYWLRALATALVWPVFYLALSALRLKLYSNLSN